MSRPVTMRAWATSLVALPLALAIVIVVETIRVVGTLEGPLVTRLFGTLAEVTSSGSRQLSIPAVLVAVASLAFWATESSRLWRRVVGWIAIGVLSCGQVAVVRAVVVGAPHLGRIAVLNVGLVGLAAVHGALMLWVSSPSRAVWARRVLGLTIAIGALVVAVAHYHFFVGVYPTIHTSVAMLAFLGVHVGLSMMVVGASFTVGRVSALVAVPALVITAGILVPAQARARGRPYVAAQSALVRPVAIAETPAELLRPSRPPHRRAVGPMRPDREALSRFAKSSGLPTLPEEFALADYDILMVIIDATRFDRTSLASPELQTTPTLAAFVRQGAFSFTKAYSPSNGTFPTLTSVLSMTPLSFAKVQFHDRHWHGELNAEQGTAPEALAKAGYRTFWLGFNFKRVMTIRVHGLESRFAKSNLELIWPGRDLDADARIVSRAIKEIRAARSAKQRYFGLVCLSSPHDDYQVHDRSMPAETPMDRYDQEVRYADGQLRRLLRAVAGGGGLDRTVVIVTSDHGEAFGEHGHRFHLSSLYVEQVHVPLVIRVPGLRGEVVETPTSLLYVLPWLLLRGEGPVREAAETVLRDDLGPMLRETKGAVVSEFISRQRQEASLRYRDYTIYHDLLLDFIRIFDARRDLQEQHDLREERPDLVRRFTPVVEAYRKVRFAGQQYHFRPIKGVRAN